MTDKVFELIKEREQNGITYKLLKEKLCGKGVWSALNALTKEEKIFSRIENGTRYYVATEYKTESDAFASEEKNMPKAKNELGSELQNILLDTIAKYSAGKIADEVLPIVREKIIKEFGVLPVTHEIKIGNAEPVKLKGELPPCFNRILSNVKNGNNVMMTGPAGTGKGYIAQKIAEATESEFYEVNAVKNEFGLTGFVDANSNFVRTPFYDACKAVSEGRKAVFLLDEMDCSDPDALKVFNEALQRKEFTFPNNEHLTFKDLIILAASNTFGTGSDDMYCGNQIDASTLNRFVLIRVDYNRKIEMSIARGDEELVDFIDGFRKQTERNGLLFVVSYRNLEQIMNNYGSYALKDCMKDCLIKSMADDDLKNVLSNMESSFAENIYYKACKGENVKWKDRYIEEENGQQVLIA